MNMCFIFVWIILHMHDNICVNLDGFPFELIFLPGRGLEGKDLLIVWKLTHMM